MRDLGPKAATAAAKPSPPARPKTERPIKRSYVGQPVGEISDAQSTALFVAEKLVGYAFGQPTLRREQRARHRAANRATYSLSTEAKMRFLIAIAGLLLIAPFGARADQGVTAGQLMANGFEVRASYMVDKGTPCWFCKKAQIPICVRLCRAILCSDFRWPRPAGRQGRCRRCKVSAHN